MTSCKLKTVNIIMTGDIGTPIDVRHVASELRDMGAESSPSIKTAVIMRSRNTRKLVVLMFASGRFVCLGTNSVSAALREIENAIAGLRSIGYDKARMMNCIVFNRVSHTALTWKPDLGALASEWPSFCSYDPELFPGVILRYPPNGSITVLVFDTGKLVITGGRAKSDVRAALDRISPLLREPTALDRISSLLRDIRLSY